MVFFRNLPFKVPFLRHRDACVESADPPRSLGPYLPRLGTLVAHWWLGVSLRSCQTDVLWPPGAGKWSRHLPFPGTGSSNHTVMCMSGFTRSLGLGWSQGSPALLLFVAQSYPTLGYPMDCSLQLLSPWNSPGKNTELDSHSFLWGSSQLRGRTCISCNASRFFTVWATGEALPGLRHLPKALWHYQSRVEIATTTSAPGYQEACWRNPAPLHNDAQRPVVVEWAVVTGRA